MQGMDVIAQAQSGTGKTATFSISILQQIDTGLRECQVPVDTKALYIYIYLKSSTPFSLPFPQKCNFYSSMYTHASCLFYYPRAVIKQRTTINYYFSFTT